jgi:hypothetical protein
LPELAIVAAVGAAAGVLAGGPPGEVADAGEVEGAAAAAGDESADMAREEEKEERAAGDTTGQGETCERERRRG